jgi:hypothetical protein
MTTPSRRQHHHRATTITPPQRARACTGTNTAHTAATCTLAAPTRARGRDGGARAGRGLRAYVVCTKHPHAHGAHARPHDGPRQPARPRWAGALKPRAGTHGRRQGARATTSNMMVPTCATLGGACPWVKIVNETRKVRANIHTITASDGTPRTHDEDSSIRAKRATHPTRNLAPASTMHAHTQPRAQ